MIRVLFRNWRQGLTLGSSNSEVVLAEPVVEVNEQARMGATLSRQLKLAAQQNRNVGMRKLIVHRIPNNNGKYSTIVAIEENAERTALMQCDIGIIKLCVMHYPLGTTEYFNIDEFDDMLARAVELVSGLS